MTRKRLTINGDARLQKLLFECESLSPVKALVKLTICGKPFSRFQKFVNF